MDLEDIKELYPFKNNYLELQNGMKMHYVDEGEGEVLLMLHGNPTWSFFYRNLIKQFSKTHRVVAPDHIGCGLSDKPQEFDYVLSNHIKHVLALIDHLKLEKITLVVHDWGGAIGFGTATERPEVFERFVVFNTAAFISKDIPFRINLCRLPGIGKLAVRGLNAFAGAATFMTTVNPMPEKVKLGFILPYDNWENRIATHEFVRDIPLEKNHKSRETLEKIDNNLNKFKNKPMLICWGRHDWCFHEKFLDVWKQRFPNADVNLLEAGHYLLEDKKDEINVLIDRFLKKNKLSQKAKA